MSSLGYNLTVVAFWLASMSWLVWTKVLPPVLLGTPPSYASILDKVSDRPVLWDIFWDGALVGTATSQSRQADDGVVVLTNRVDFRDLPVAKLNPLRIRALSDLLERTHPKISMWAETRFEIDPLGRLLSFESQLGSGLLPEPIQVLGSPEGNRLRLNVRSRDFSYRADLYVPPDHLIGDALSPQARMPGLRIGQSWTEPVYSPFSPPNQPMEVLQAVVERQEPFAWGGPFEKTYLVVYRSRSGTGTAAAQNEPRGTTWVRPDGTVLQYEARIGSSKVRFVRRKEPSPPVTTEPTEDHRGVRAR